jgi:hypothetical protein
MTRLSYDVPLVIELLFPVDRTTWTEYGLALSEYLNVCVKIQLPSLHFHICGEVHLTLTFDAEYHHMSQQCFVP